MKEPRIILTITFFLLLLAAYHLSVQADELGVLFVSRRWTGVFALFVIGAVLDLGLFIVSWTSLWNWMTRVFQSGLMFLTRLRWGNLLLYILSIGIYAWLVLGSLGYLFENYFVRLSLFWLLTLTGVVFIKSFLLSDNTKSKVYADASWFKAIVASWILAGFGYQLALVLPELSSYPFSLGWSETSRYYYASLYFAKEIYGVEVIPSVLHPSRYMMQAVPFLVPGLPLWFHRLWQVLIWVSTAILTVYLLSKRLSLASHRIKFTLILFMAWAYLFLFQGPVYYHLLVCVIIVLWGFESDKFWKSLIVVVFASAWAGISRINWYPVPGLLAAAIYLLEKGFPETGVERNTRIYWKDVASYLLNPVVWVGLGTLVAIGTQVVYVLWSGAEPGEFTSSFTSDLLWYRMFPNPTLPVGILLAILLISAPLLILIIKGLRRLHPLRLLGVGSILLALLVGGVIVSTKIGGGSNLHNLDAYLVILLVIGGYVYFDKVRCETQLRHESLKVSSVLLGLIAFVPVLYALSFGGPLTLPSNQAIEQVLNTLDEMTSEVVEQGGDVLFITERQLLTFGYLKDIPLVEEFETVFLMEMAMSGNQKYLSEFHQNLSEQSYDLIITDQQRINYKGRDYSFGEENDVWVVQVTEPMLKYYQREVLFKELGIEVLVPKE